MTKAVFISNVVSNYDDLPEERYHFPGQYLKRIEQTVGDYIIYYESRRGNGRQVYFATAKVSQIRKDSKLKDHYYADVEDFLPFLNPVPFRDNRSYFETSLLNSDGTLNQGRVRSAVHFITEVEYQNILHAGFIPLLNINKNKALNFNETVQGFSEEQSEFQRPIIETISRRPFRDQAFAVAVKTVYENTCAMTGLKILNGGGKAEVQAAHIRPVHDKGPDSIRNGLALSGTVHWMFDRGLISVSDDYKILKSRGNIPEAINSLMLPKGEIILPNRADCRPHPTFLKFHRERVFKG